MISETFKEKTEVKVDFNAGTWKVCVIRDDESLHKWQFHSRKRTFPRLGKIKIYAHLQPLIVDGRVANSTKYKIQFVKRQITLTTLTSMAYRENNISIQLIANRYDSLFLRSVVFRSWGSAFVIAVPRSLFLELKECVKREVIIWLYRFGSAFHPNLERVYPRIKGKSEIKWKLS